MTIHWQHLETSISISSQSEENFEVEQYYQVEHEPLKCSSEGPMLFVRF